jgi:FtsP/CotA-like multicopper oxidase with cupredoxin domain
MPTRRTVVISAAAAAYVDHAFVRVGRAPAATPSLTPFVDALPLPRVLRPVGQSRRPGLLYEVEAQEVRQRLHRDLPETKVWGYAGSYPGPTIAAFAGQPIYVRYRNRLLDGMHPLWSPESWLGEFGQVARWSFCLTAARMAREQERR